MEASRRIGKSREDLRTRLKALRAKKLLTEQHNKRDLAQALKIQRIRSLNQKNLEKSLLNAEEQLEKISSVESGKEIQLERKQALTYTIADVIEWHKNNKKDPNAKVTGGYNNFSDLAARSYKRDMSTLAVDLAAYKEDTKSHRSQLNDIIQPKNDKAIITGAVDHLQKGNDRRQLLRRTQSDDAGVSHHINEKNRQFNLKLNRQYDKKDLQK